MPIVIAIVAIVLIGAGAYVFTSSSEPTPEPTNVVTEAPATEETVATNEPEPMMNEEMEADTEAAEPAPESSSAYADGTYTVDAFYLTPRRTRHDMAVTLTVADGVVTDANILYDGVAAQTPNHTNFDEAYKAEVVGMPLDEISLSRVGGASLTSDAFNDAVAEVKNQAAA